MCRDATPGDRNAQVQFSPGTAELARENYRRRGTLISRMLYEFWYVLLGIEAFDQQTLTPRCPLALEEIHRLAIDAP